MLNIVMAAAFQHVEMPNKVGISIRVRVFQGVAYTAWGGKMNNTIKLLSREKRGHTFPVG